MSDVWNDEKSESVGSTLTVEQLKQLQATKSTAHMEIELCYSKKKAFVKPIKVNDKKEALKAIESKNSTLVNKALDNILEKYVEFEDTDVSVDQLVMQERYQILTYIRVANGEKKAVIGHQCPDCEKVTKDIEFNMDDLSLKMYEGNPKDDIVILPLDGENHIDIHIKPLTRNDEKRAERYCKTEKYDTMSEKSVAYVAASIKKIIAYVNGIKQNVEFKNFDEVVDYYKNVSSEVDEKIKDILKKYDFGVKMPLDFTCQHCGYHDENEEVNVAVFFIS